MKMKDCMKAMKNLIDNLALASHPMSIDGLVTQVFASLDSQEYNLLVCQIIENENINWIKLQSKLLSYEKRLEQLNAGVVAINLHHQVVNYARSPNFIYKNQSSIIIEVDLRAITKQERPSGAKEATNNMEVTDLYARFVIRLDILMIFIITNLIKVI